MSMINTHSPMGNHSTTILKKPVVAISEDEKNAIKEISGQHRQKIRR